MSHRSSSTARSGRSASTSGRSIASPATRSRRWPAWGRRCSGSRSLATTKIQPGCRGVLMAAPGVAHPTVLTFLRHWSQNYNVVRGHREYAASGGKMDGVLLAGRLILAVVFGVAGVAKVLDP